MNNRWFYQAAPPDLPVDLGDRPGPVILPAPANPGSAGDAAGQSGPGAMHVIGFA
jgi:hypothetical protein